MDGWPLDGWDRLQAVVASGNYVAANEEFTILKASVLKASREQLASQAAHAGLALEFLLGFAAKKGMYRSHIAKVFSALLAVPAWREALAARPDLQAQVPSLHPDLQAAISSPPSADDAEPAPTAAPAQKATPRRTAPPEWPDWGAIETAVVMDGYMGANDEFAALRNAVRDATPEEIDAQRSHAGLVWDFIVGFAEKKTMYRSQLAQTIGRLIAVRSWQDAYAARPQLQARAAALHQDLRIALGECLPEGNAVPTSAGQPQDDEISPDDIEPEDMPSPGGKQRKATGEDLDRRLAAIDAVDPPNPAVEALASKPPPAAHSVPPADAPAGATPASWGKRVQPFLQRAVELEASEPLVAHFCRVHAVEQLIRARHSQEADNESNALLMATLEEAETKKKALDLSQGQQKMTAFARSIYEAAIAADRAGHDSSGNVATQLYVASLFLDILAQFYDGQLPDSLAVASQYARSRAVLLRDCTHSGEMPSPPTAPAFHAPGAQPEAPPAARPAAPAAPAAAEPALVPIPAAAPAPPMPPAALTPAAVALPQPSPPAAQVHEPVQSWSAVLTPEQVAWPAAKRKLEAQRCASQAASALESHDANKACRQIREALGLLDGLR